MNENKSIYSVIGTEFEPDKMQNLTKAVESSTDLEQDFLEQDVKVEDEVIKPGRWAVSGNRYYLCDDTADKLKTGVYSIEFSMSIGVYLRHRKIKTDELITFPDAASDEVTKYIKDFWHLKEKFIEYNFVYKRGILLYGPPGGGKTSTVFQIIKFMNESKGITLISDYPDFTEIALDMVRKLEPDRPIMVVMEDIDTIVYRYGDKKLTAILDGELNVDNVVFLATTNYPERLPARLLKRPSRFDVVEYIGFPNEEARKIYLTKKTSLSPSIVNTWAEKTEGFTIAHIKELITLVFIYKKTLDEAIERLREMATIVPPDREKKDKDVNLKITIDNKIPALEIPKDAFNINPPKSIKIIERDKDGLITIIREEEVQ